jgi:predicted nucleic acid-binding protein
MFCVDSSGWIEFFLGSTAGRTFKPIIEQTSELIVPALSFFEVHRYLIRNADAQRRDECLDVMRRSTVIELTTARAIAASNIAQKHRLAMADAVMYSIAQEFNATFWTQDVDYKDLPGVSFHSKDPGL